LSRLKDWEDKRSWREFFNTYWKLIYSVGVKAGLTEEEAQDLVQETMLSVAKQMPSFRYDPKKGSFKAWLMKIIQRRLIDYWRKRPPWAGEKSSAQDNTARTSTTNQIPTPREFNMESIWNEEWQKNLVGAAMENVKRKITPRQYQIFDLYVIKEWTVRDVTQTLHVSAAQVYLAKLRVSRLVQAEVRRLESKVK
jgi:RNA polymerase sigma-70 factor (ECF subfamily)